MLVGQNETMWKPWLIRETHLHADHSVDEKDHGNEQTDIRQSLSRMKSKAQLPKNMWLQVNVQ